MELNQQVGSKKGKSSKPVKNQEAEISALMQLQDFLSDELLEQGTAYRRAFIPLTEGLGLESPRQVTPKISLGEQKEELEEAVSFTAESQNETPEVPKREVTTEVITVLKSHSMTSQKTEVRHNENRLAEVIEPPKPVLMPEARFFETESAPKEENLTSSLSHSSATQPPPLPRPSGFTRALAGVIDQVFVLLIWTGMIVLTSNLISDFTTGFSLEIISDFAQPQFQRMAVLEFAAAWFGYLGFSLLIFKRTFGMWVWSIGVSYGDKVEENYTLRKAMRIFWTFVFSAPIVPSVLLIVRKNGRNLLDILSGTQTYEAN